MNKRIVVYQENSSGKIAKFIDGVEVVDGVVVNEGREDGWNPFRWFASLFGASNPTRDTDNDHIINTESFQAVESYNDPASPDYQYQVNYEIISDNQGPVPYWDGYNGE